MGQSVPGHQSASVYFPGKIEVHLVSHHPNTHTHTHHNSFTVLKAWTTDGQCQTAMSPGSKGWNDIASHEPVLEACPSAQ